jgi:MOSC domain-containing protein YiiM
LILPPPESTLGAMLARFPRRGRVTWIGLRPARGVSMHAVERAQAVAGRGLAGDRFSGGGNGKRGVTLIQAEHLPVIAALVARDVVKPETLRRNVVVSGLPLIALKGRRFRIGEVLLEGTGPCEPCSKMEIALGDGGYNAMRGHGGLCARVLEGGEFRVGDAVVALNDGDE